MFQSLSDIDGKPRPQTPRRIIAGAIVGSGQQSFKLRA